ncbi:MAG: biopolymer transporter ExbD [Cyclobacteriaceae bacterium]|nr:biopolymer transporter ExbD [Cyclobacteriaceae bacterium]
MAKKPRGLPQVNSSSMADIAFLLLIFFLVTTTIATDRGLTLVLPPKLDPNQPPPDITKNQRNIFKILVNSQDRILVEDEPFTDIPKLRGMVKEFVLNFGRPKEEDIQLFNSLPPSLRGLSMQTGESSDSPQEAVVSFKTDRGTSYDIYIQILDELQGAYYEIYGERVGISADEFRNLDQRNPADKAKYDAARENLPMNISIAEPSRIGG